MLLVFSSVQLSKMNYYDAFEDQDLNDNLQLLTTIGGMNFKDRFLCISECVKLSNCSTVSFTHNSGACKLYSMNANSYFTKQSKQTTIYSLRASFIESLFFNYAFKQEFVGPFSFLCNFELVNVNSTINYYLVDYSLKKIIVTDDKWNVKLSYTLGFSPAYITRAGDNAIFLSGNAMVYKAHLNGTIIASQPSKNSLVYRGMFYNESSQLLYVASYATNRGEINVYNQNLTWLRSIDFGSSQGFRVEGYDGRLYAGALKGGRSSVMVFENEILVNNFTTECIWGHQWVSVR